jgi:RHS repeat-associated protein
LLQKGYNGSINGIDNKYKYNGKELQDELGLNWDSFKYRNYDYGIGRFMSIDPLSEEYAYNSPYAFAENKLGMGRELEGLEMFSERSKDGKSVTITYNVQPINNSQLTNQQFNTAIQDRRITTEQLGTGKTAEGLNQITKVVIDPKATITWEYVNVLDFGGKPEILYGNAPGVTAENGNTQVNRTQVNVNAIVDQNEDGTLKSITPAAKNEMRNTAAHEDFHVGGSPDIGDPILRNLSAKMQKNPNNVMNNAQTTKPEVEPEQRSRMVRKVEEQQK